MVKGAIQECVCVEIKSIRRMILDSRVLASKSISTVELSKLAESKAMLAEPATLAPLNPPMKSFLRESLC